MFGGFGDAFVDVGVAEQGGFGTNVGGTGGGSKCEVGGDEFSGDGGSYRLSGYGAVVTGWWGVIRSTGRVIGERSVVQ